MSIRTAMLCSVPAALLGAFVVACALGAGTPSQAELGEDDLPDKGSMPSLNGATAWLNSQPLSPNDLRGKVVVVQFLTFSCINWLRTVPHMRAWHARYASEGVVVLGVHSPEFQFERESRTVEAALDTLDINFPVAIDSNLAVWRAFDNNYWPALYIVDAKGRLRHHHFGEGDFEKTERVIQRLLSEAGHIPDYRGVVEVDARGAEAPADWDNLRSPEEYIGYGRARSFSGSGGLVRERRNFYSSVGLLRLNRWELAGSWTARKEAAVANEAGAKIRFRFHARDLHMVMGSTVSGRPARFRLTVDGEPPRTSHGHDANEIGAGAVAEARLYQLIRQDGEIVDREFEIEFLDPGVEVYSFTFG